jgi:hypothetical protein
MHSRAHTADRPIDQSSVLSRSFDLDRSIKAASPSSSSSRRLRRPNERTHTHAFLPSFPFHEPIQSTHTHTTPAAMAAAAAEGKAGIKALQAKLADLKKEKAASNKRLAPASANPNASGAARRYVRAYHAVGVRLMVERLVDGLDRVRIAIVMVGSTG